MSHMKFQVEVLEKFCKDAFQKFGFSEEESPRLRMSCCYLIFTASNPTECSVCHAITKALKRASSRWTQSQKLCLRLRCLP